MPRNKQQMPMCQYGTSCTRKGCVYRHPPPSKARVSKSTEICVHFISGNCTFGDKCANRHPGRIEAAKFRETCAAINCRFGAGCANAACLYAHDGRGRAPPAGKASPPLVPAPEFNAPPPPVVIPSGDRWWTFPGAFGDGYDACDPISLEPLAELEYPPFHLEEGGALHFFDGAVLATYLVSTANFVNPMTRTPMAREACRALDEYLVDHGLRKDLGAVLVTHAFDLLELTSRGTGGAEERAMVSRSQREATTVLRSLFGFSRYEPPPDEAANAQTYVDAYEPRPVEQLPAPTPAAGIGPSMADAIEEDDDDDDDRLLREAVATDRPSPAVLDAHAFPALSALAGLLPAPGADGDGGLSFADRAARAPAFTPGDGGAANGAYVETSTGGAARRSVRVPREIWVPLRNARVFEVRDPLERYKLVASAHDRHDVIDLHFQSNRTAPVVLAAFLDAAVRANADGVWVVTGSGHHAPKHSHQKLKANLFTFTADWLADRGYTFAVAKDHNGFAGAFLVLGLPAHARGASLAAAPTYFPPPPFHDGRAFRSHSAAL